MQCKEKIQTAKKERTKESYRRSVPKEEEVTDTENFSVS